MNLIVSRASKDYVLQMTGGRAPENVLFHARNGIAAMAYAGLHEIGGVATGRWLAANLTPECDLGQALTKLARALEAAAVPLEEAFDLHVVGWQWSGRRARPVVAGVSKDPGMRGFPIQYLTRYWYLDRGRPGRNGRRGYRFNVTAAPDRYIRLPQLQRLVQGLRDLTPDDAESLIGGAIRGISEWQPEAGPQRISILLYPPGAGRAVVRSVRGAAAPWLVAVGERAAPLALSETKEVQLGTYTVTLQGHVTP